MDIDNKDKAPSISVVLPYFLLAALSFVLLTIGLFFYGDNLLSHYYQAKTLAFTHITVLGWITMIIMGALYQLTPVIFEVSLYSERLSKINLYIYTIGTFLMVFAFWTGNFGYLLTWSSILVLIGISTFSVNILLSIRQSNIKNYISKFIGTSMFWLLSTAILGILMALNHQFDLFDSQFPDYIKIHAHMGIVGWFLQLIIGVSAVLFPMFLISHDLEEKKLKYAYNFINIGLVITLISWFIPKNFFIDITSYINPISILSILIGLSFYLRYILAAYRNKLRKLDIGMQLSTVSLIHLSIPILIIIGIVYMQIFQRAISPSFFNLYGFSIFLAFITPLILGQTYKTLPFIVWLHYYQRFVGKKKIKMPGDLFNKKIAHLHMWTFIVAILLMSSGMIWAHNSLLRIGSLFLVITAGLYLYNVLKIVFHRPDAAIMEAIHVPLSTNILEVLKQVIDPEVEINIVDMGLIYKVEEDEDKNINIDMTLSTPNCPIADSIVMNVMEIVQSAYPDHHVNVNLVFDPKWDPSLISEEGKKNLDKSHKWLV